MLQLLKRVWKIAKWTFIVLLGLFLVLSAILSIPAVQTKIGQTAVSFLKDEFGVEIEIGKLNYRFPNRFIIEDAYAPDWHNDTLFFAKRIDFVFEGFVNNSLYAEEIILREGKFNLEKMPGDTCYNFYRWLDYFNTGPADPNSPDFNMYVGRVDVRDLSFNKYAEGCDSCTNFFVRHADLHVQDFALKGDEVYGNVRRMRWEDEDHFSLHEFRAKTAYTHTGIQVHNLYFKTDNSELKGNADLNYRNTDAFSDFLNLVRFDAVIEESSMSSAEFQSLIPEFPNFDQFSITGRVTGPLEQMHVENADVALSNSKFFGNVDFKHLTEPDLMYIDAHIGYCKTNGGDLRQYVGQFIEDTIPALIDRFTQINLTGHYEGTLSEFKTRGDLNTNLGKLTMNMNFKDLNNPEIAVYAGHLETKNLDLGKLFDVEGLQYVNLNADLHGKSFDVNQMSSDLRMKVSRLDYNNYSYSGLNIDGLLNKGVFTGDIHLKDPNVKFDFDGSIDFLSDTSHYKFKAELTDANLYALHFTTDTISVVNAKIESDLLVFKDEWWNGELQIFDPSYHNSNQFYFFRDIYCSAENEGGQLVTRIHSELVDGSITGRFKLFEFHKIFMMAFSKVYKFYDYSEPSVDANCAFALNFNNVGLLTDIFMPELYLEPGTLLYGSVNTDKLKLNATFKSPFIAYDEMEFNDILFNINGSEGIYNLNFNVDNADLGGGIEIDTFALRNVINRDSVNYNLLAIIKDTVNSRIQLNGTVTNPDKGIYSFGIAQSGFNVNLDTLHLMYPARINLANKNVFIDNVFFKGRRGSFSLNGTMSKDPWEILRVGFNDLDLNVLNYFLRDSATVFGGIANGMVIINDPLDEIRFSSDLQIDTFSFNNHWLGNLTGLVDWDVRSNQINVDVKTTRGSLNMLEVTGGIHPDSSEAINLDISMNRFRIGAFEPYVQGILSKVRGVASGKLHVGGNTNDLKFDGEIKLPNAAFTVPFLQTDYSIDGEAVLLVKNDRFELEPVNIRDTKEQTTGRAFGSIYHQNLGNLRFDIHVEAENLLALNTTERDFEYFYGKGYATGEVTISGPVSSLILRADITTERNTNVKIPLSNPTEVSGNSFVTFIDPTKIDTAQGIQYKRQSKASEGLAIDLNLHLKPTALVELVLEETVGDIIKGYGFGDLRIQMNPQGELSMFGAYEIAGGDYLFTMKGLINKKFTMVPGGQVTWNGDPFGAQINMSAMYTTRTTLTGVVTSSDYTGNRVQVNLLMKLSGPLMNPNIDFDIRLPNANTAWQEELRNRMADHDRLVNQSFSLLILNSFLTEGSSESAVTNAASNNLYEMATQQISNMLGKGLGDYIDLNFDYNQNEYSDEIEVGLSKPLFDDRVVVTTNFDVPLNTAQNTNTGQASANNGTVPVDMDVQYKITEDGRFRVKVFYRSNYEDPTLIAPTSQGVGVFYRVDFNTYSELMKKVFGITPSPTTPQETEENENGESASPADPPSQN